MALKTLVKVSEVNNLSDARYCAGMGVDMVGFNLNEGSDNYINPENFLAITGWLEGVKFVAEFENTLPDNLTTYLSDYSVQFIQVNKPELVNELLQSNLEIPIILKLTAKNELSVYRSVFQELGETVSHFLIESEKEEVISETSFNELKHTAAQNNILVGYGIFPNNLEQILEGIKPIGIALKGGNEIRPGYKDFDELADILEELELN